MKKLVHLIWLIILFNPLATYGEPIYSFDDTIEGNSFNHVSFQILRDIEIQMVGTSQGEIEFLAFNELNYKKWINQTDFLPIFQEYLKGDFDILFTPSLDINESLHLLFINHNQTSFEVSFVIEEFKSNSNDSSLWFFPIVFALLISLKLNRKTLTKS